MLGEIEAVVVKQARGRLAAECLPPSLSQEEIEKAARRAVERLRQGEAPKPLKLESPITIAVELTNSEMADRAAWLPGAIRQERTISYSANDMPSIYRAFRVIVGMAS